MPDATPLLKLYAKWRLSRLDRQDSRDVQRRQLARLVKRAAGTRFGRDHGFGEIGGVEDFQRRVPMRRYEDFWQEY